MTTRLVCLLALSLGFAGELAGQASGTPSFNAPYRAFGRSEFGGTISFPEGGGVAFEGAYRGGYKTFDVGVRGGMFDPGGTSDVLFIVGAEARTRVITHTVDFPLDGAVIFGLGGNFGGGQSVGIIPAGLSLGRRLDLVDSPVSIVPYVQPTAFFVFGNGTSDVNFSLGLGADFRLSRVFDARVSAGLGDVQGVALSAVWVH
jgi:hypothetical protein